MGLLDGKAIIVTGGGQGIGEAICLGIAAEGGNVLVADINEETASAVAAKCAALGVKAVAMKCDVTNEAEGAAAVKKSIDELGGVWGVVNNAGITQDSTLLKMTEQQWDRVMAVNLKSLYTMSKPAVAYMKESGAGGSIINISSIVGKMGNFGQTNYCASKAGVVGFTKALAKEYAKAKIRSNAIQPGFIKTAMTDAMPERAIQGILAMVPAGTMGLPEDIANAVVFLLSEKSKYITGTVVEVAGGLGM
jgi:3-oxoacyl-[acyl-carrier protein] reductase